MRWFLLLLLIPSVAYAAENCSMLGGTCRQSCGQSESPEAGVFLDCKESEQCCVTGSEATETLRCCIHTFDRRSYGPQNCSQPAGAVCAKGSGSPVPCEKLKMCQGE